MTILERLRRYVRRQAFLPTRFGVFTNPSYILRSRLCEAVRASAPSIQGRVLDFGCGSKPYKELFSKATQYVGLDIKVSGHSHSDSNVDVFYDGKTIPFPDSHFDAIVSFEVFEHVFDMPAVLLEIRRVLKPSGKLLVTLPFAWPEHEQPYDFARYTSFGLSSALTSGGFDVVRMEKTGNYVLAIAQLMISFVYLLTSGYSRTFSTFCRLLILPPMTIIALGFSKILPRRNEYFCNLVVLAERRTG